MTAGGDPPEVFEGLHQPDGAVETAVETGYVVEENNTGDAVGVAGFAEVGAHDGLESAGFENEGTAEPVGFGGEEVPRGEGSRGGADGCAIDDDAGGFASGVGVDDTNGNGIRHGILFAVSIGPPVTEELPLGMEELALAELIVPINLVFISGVAFENHELFIEHDQVGIFADAGKHGGGFAKFKGPAAVLLIPGSGGSAEFGEAKDFLG